jgi:predicted transcriptional regulator
MSGAEVPDELGRELCRELRDEPLDVRQLAADLGAIPVAVTMELNALIDAGLVHAMAVDGGEADVGLTVKGRTRLLGKGEP